MKISFISPHLNVCGGVRVILRLAQYLTRLGHTVNVLANKTGAGAFWLFPKPEFPILRVGSSYTEYIEKDTDVVVDFLDGDLHPIPKKTKRVLFLQGYGTQDKDKEEENLSRDFDGVITTSKWLYDLVIHRKKRNVFIVPPGIDNIFKPKIAKKFYFHIGGLYHRSSSKNTHTFINVANSFYAATHGEVIPLLISSKYDKNNTLLDKFTCPFSLIINAPQKILPDVYSSLSVWISTSSNEGFGLTVLEAMACGVPVIYMPNKGLDGYVVSGKNCLMARNEKEILEHLFTLQKDSSLRGRLIAEGINLAKSFTWDKSSRLFEQRLKEICS